MMTRPGPVLILSLQYLGLDFAIPLHPFRAARAAQTVADIQIGEELFSANRPETLNESPIRKPALNGVYLFRVLPSILCSAAELLQFLSVLVQRYARSCREGARASARNTSDNTSDDTSSAPGADTATRPTAHRGRCRHLCVVFDTRERLRRYHDAFCPSRRQTLGRYGSTEDGSPSTADIPTAVLQLMMLDLGNALL